MENLNARLNHSIQPIRNRIRLLLLLHAAEKAGLAPLPITHLHVLAYMSNVLSPVWDAPLFEGKVLKRRGSPFYTSLQREVDRLVGMGLVLVTNTSHVLDADARWRLEGSYCLRRPAANRVFASIEACQYECGLRGFLQEVAYALSALSADDLGRATTEDATYGDPAIDVGNVVDFAEWEDRNCTANAALRFERLLPGGARATRAEMLHLYVLHLFGRLQGVR